MLRFGTPLYMEVLQKAGSSLLLGVSVFSSSLNGSSSVGVGLAAGHLPGAIGSPIGSLSGSGQ